MKISKIPSWASGFLAGIMVFAIALFILGTFSSSFLQGTFSGTSEDFSFVDKTPVLKGPGYPPVFAYYISGTSGENGKILRLLKAVYHPRNRYLLGLDADSSAHERWKLAVATKEESVFRAFRNVDVVGRSNAVDKMGSSAVADTLHAAALLLKVYKDWDWFITLSASEYPVMTQDDLLHAFTFLPKDLNFIHFSNSTEWKEKTGIKRLVLDPNLYVLKNSEIFYSADNRETPDAFKVFGGSPSGILTRVFMEYCVHGWDNLPRTLLLYFTNVASPLQFYFHTVLCNSGNFQNTIVNNNLRYMVLDVAPQVKEPHFLNLSNFTGTAGTVASFAGYFQEGDEVLQKLDEKILRRPLDGVLPGKWCLSPAVNQSAEHSNLQDACSSWGNINALKPGSQGLKLAKFLSKLVAERRLRSNQCRLQ